MTSKVKISMEKWLVEITIKNYVYLKEEKDRIFHFYEIEAINDVAARFKAMDIFENEIKILPLLKERFNKMGLDITDYCAATAIVIT